MNVSKIFISLLLFLLAGICEIGGGFMVWLWIREDMTWIYGVLGGFILFLYGVIPTFQSMVGLLMGLRLIHLT